MKYALLCVAVIAATCAFRFFVMTPFIIRSDAMAPDFKKGDYVIIQEVRQPQPGDVVILHSRAGGFLIRRVVAHIDQDYVVADNTGAEAQSIPAGAVVGTILLRVMHVPLLSQLL